MPLMLSLSPIIRYSHVNQFRINSVDPNCTPLCCNINPKFSFIDKTLPTILRKKIPSSKYMTRECLNSSNDFFSEEIIDSDDWGEQDEEGVGYTDDVNDLESSPWEGAVMYQRNASISHVEYCTTLERLGLGRLSTEVSKSRASLMGLRVTKSVKDFPLGTPVLISVDVTKKKHKLRLDGILRTVITLDCNRCGNPAAECVFSNFSLLLTEEPIEEPETSDLGVIFGKDKFRIPTGGEGEEDDEASIDLDDRIYFPPEEKVLDISKHMRDIVHLEITLNAVCDPTCKGLCLGCGINLNTSSCKCSKQKVKEKASGTFGDLKEQMQL